MGPKSSKVIRAGKLTDLIFNGGKDKKKAAKYCTVSLVFDNSDRRLPIDTDKVILTRTVKRAPLKNNPDNYYSYFYINGKSSSLSDFENLLIHARISGDGYNLVKQGDITTLVEMGPVERRKIIDDIAGISTFDRDIEKAEREKEEAEDNIKRIGIVLDEINRQLEQLKRDRDGAIRYRELQNKLYETKAKIAYKKKMDIESQLAEVHRQIESYEKEKDKLDNKIKEKREQYEDIKSKFEEIEKKISNTGGDEAKEIKEKIDLIRTEIARIDERVEYTKKELRNLSREREDIKKSLDDISKEMESYHNNIDSLYREMEEKESQINEIDGELKKIRDTLSHSGGDIVEITRELSQLREDYNNTTNNIHQLQLKKERLTEKIEVLSTRIAELEETKSTYEFEIKDLDWQIKENEKTRKEETKKRENIDKKIFQKRKEQAELTEQLRDIENSMRILQREYSQIKAEYDASESLRKGYTTAVLKILEARDKGILKGVHGTIAELAKVDPKYEVAMKIAAGQRLQSIVVDDDNVAAEAIEFLRKNKLGRATFLPINKMILGRPRAKALLAVQDEKSHGFAMDVISFNKRYESAFWYVFGDTVVVENLDVARKLMGGVRLVTLKGDLIEASGAIKGGSIERQSLSFSHVDRAKLDEMEEKLRSVMDSHDNLINKLDEIKKEIDKLQQEKETIESKILSNNKELEVQRKEFIAKFDVVKKELEGRFKERSELEEELKDTDDEIKDLNKRVEELNKLKDEKGKLLSKGKSKDLAENARELEEKLFSLKDLLLKIKNDRDIAVKQMKFLEERERENRERLEEIDKELKEKKKNLELLKKDRSEKEENLESLISLESNMTGKMKNLSQERDKIYREMVSLETEMDKIVTRIESYVDLISRAKYRLPSLEDSIRALEEEISRYEVSIEPSDLPSVESLVETSKLIDENMRELEPVNMRALEEYEHQEQRKMKLEEDVGHLREQKRNLVRLVKEISKKKKNRFYEVFNEINDNFREIYSQLSEGGEAELQLDNREEPFEGGLNIKVRPKGKKVLHMSALSGGEKSMASLALIFAIQSYDPSPFYLLDEVDMFLDSINAESVSRMIKRNADHSQFIMVSLRKVAIKEADHIYGVTMRGDGISEMIGTVDLSAIGSKGEILTNSGGIKI